MAEIDQVIDQHGLRSGRSRETFKERVPDDSGMTIELIERGQIDRLWDMVYRLQSGMPG